MIRDPSDGSVREPEAHPGGAQVDLAPAKPVMTSGLPTGSQKPKNIARLEASREWLKDYHAKRKGGLE